MDKIWGLGSLRKLENRRASEAACKLLDMIADITQTLLSGTVCGLCGREWRRGPSRSSTSRAPPSSGEGPRPAVPTPGSRDARRSAHQATSWHHVGCLMQAVPSPGRSGFRHVVAPHGRSPHEAQGAHWPEAAVRDSPPRAAARLGILQELQAKSCESWPLFESHGAKQPGGAITVGPIGVVPALGLIGRLRTGVARQLEAPPR